MNVSFSLTIAFFSVARGLFTRTFNFLADVAHLRVYELLSLNLAFVSVACGFFSRLSTALARNLLALALGFACRARLRQLLIYSLFRCVSLSRRYLFISKHSTSVNDMAFCSARKTTTT